MSKRNDVNGEVKYTDNEQEAESVRPDVLKAKRSDIDRVSSSVTVLVERCDVIENSIRNQSSSLVKLKDQYSKLKGASETVDSELKALKKSINSKANLSLANTKFEQIEQKFKQIEQKADQDSTGVSSSDMKNVQNNQAFNTCLFLCATLLLNIIASWVIVFKPGYSGLADTNVLPWFSIVSLVSIMLVNIVATAIWSYHFWASLAMYADWEILTEVFLLILGMVAMWVFALFSPEKITGIVIALAVLLMLANVSAMIMRIIHFSNELTSADIDCDEASFAVSIIETALLVAIAVILTVIIVVSI